MSRATGAQRLAVAVTIVLGFLLLLGRRPSAIGAPTFWAEDGAVFFLERRFHGLSLFVPYQDQIWVLQRLIAGVLPLPAAPALHAYHLVSIAVATSALAVVLQQRARATFGGLPWRIGGFILLLALPGVWEVQGTLANLHVYAAISVVLCLTLPVPTAAWSRWVEAGWVLIVALTGFVSAVLLPAAIWQSVRYRSRWAYLRLALVVGGLVVAALVWLTGDRPVVSDVTLRDRLIIMVKSTVLRVGSPLLFGEETAARGWQIGAAVLVVALVAALVLRDWRGPSPAWVLSGVVWIVLGVQSVPAASILALLQPFYSERYFAVMTAMCLLVMLRAAAMDPLAWIRGVAIVALVLTLPGLVRGYSLPTSDPYSPAERSELQRCAMSRDILCPLPVRPQGWIRPL